MKFIKKINKIEYKKKIKLNQDINKKLINFKINTMN